MKTVLLAGEGRNELGGWFAAPPNRDPSEPGVLEALLKKVASSMDWKIGDAIPWKNIPKFVAGGHASAEKRTVKQLLQKARERQFDIVVFVRDQDTSGTAGLRRRADLDAAVEEFETSNQDGNLSVVGGVAVLCLEAWVLALRGGQNTEALSRKRAQEQAAQQQCHTTGEMVAAVENANLDSLPTDAGSLSRWLARARDALAAPQKPSWPKFPTKLIY